MQREEAQRTGASTRYGDGRHTTKIASSFVHAVGQRSRARRRAQVQCVAGCLSNGGHRVGRFRRSGTCRLISSQWPRALQHGRQRLGVGRRSPDTGRGTKERLFRSSPSFCRSDESEKGRLVYGANRLVVLSSAHTQHTRAAVQFVGVLFRLLLSAVSRELLQPLQNCCSWQEYRRYQPIEPWVSVRVAPPGPPPPSSLIGSSSGRCAKTVKNNNT